MKVKKLIKKYFKAIVEKDFKRQVKFYSKILKKSLKKKNTQPIQ